MLYAGVGCLQDHEAALAYYLMAANAGIPDSMNAVGLMYEEGRGTERDARLAHRWYKKAADLG